MGQRPLQVALGSAEHPRSHPRAASGFWVPTRRDACFQQLQPYVGHPPRRSCSEPAAEPTPLTAPRSRLPPSRFICLGANCFGSKGKEGTCFVTGPMSGHPAPRCLPSQGPGSASDALKGKVRGRRDAVDAVSPLPGRPGSREAPALAPALLPLFPGCCLPASHRSSLRSAPAPSPASVLWVLGKGSEGDLWPLPAVVLSHPEQ